MQSLRSAIQASALVEHQNKGVLPHCRTPRGVYRFIAPDGRSYVGSCTEIDRHGRQGLGRSNSRMVEVFDRHPPETWKFDIMERLPPGCSKADRRAAEQRHIDRFAPGTRRAALTCTRLCGSVTARRSARLAGSLPRDLG